MCLSGGKRLQHRIGFYLYLLCQYCYQKWYATIKQRAGNSFCVLWRHHLLLIQRFCLSSEMCQRRETWVSRFIAARVEMWNIFPVFVNQCFQSVKKKCQIIFSLFADKKKQYKNWLEHVFTESLKVHLVSTSANVNVGVTCSTLVFDVSAFAVEIKWETRDVRPGVGGRLGNVLPRIIRKESSASRKRR